MEHKNIIDMFATYQLAKEDLEAVDVGVEAEELHEINLIVHIFFGQ
jgi:hypothetical protein